MTIKFKELFLVNMRKVELGNTGEQIPILGQGTWGIKSRKGKDYYDSWKKSLRKGIELGLTHIDTAEMYGFGTSEKVVGDIISEYNRDDLFITSKLFPMHLSFRTMKKGASKSLKRLRINNFDLYLIHWPSPFSSTKKQMKILDYLVKEGKTRYVGVSNFSVEQFKESLNFLNNDLVTNQLHANVTKQKHMSDSLPYYQKSGVTLTAYSPLGHKGYSNLNGELLDKLNSVAKAHDATIQQIAIAWLINHKNVIAIPKAFKIEHVEANAKAAEIILSEKEIKLIENLEAS